jgi:hypothetical protein
MVLFVILSYLVPTGILIAGISITAKSHNSIAMFIAALIGLVLFVLALPRFVGGSVSLVLAGVHGTKMSFKEALAAGKPFGWRVVGANILVGLLSMLGFLLLVIPGILVVNWYYLVSFLIVEENLSIGAAMSRSKQLVSGRFWDVFGTWTVPSLFGILNIIPLLGGLAAAILTLLYSAAQAERYRQLKTAKDSGQPLPPVSPLNYLMPVVFVLGFGMSVIYSMSGLNKEKSPSPIPYSQFESGDTSFPADTSTDAQY